MGSGCPVATLPTGEFLRVGVWACGPWQGHGVSAVFCLQGRIIECTHCGCRGCSG